MQIVPETSDLAGRGWIDSPTTTTLDDRIEDSRVLPCHCVPKEEPVLFPDGRRTDRVIDRIVIYLNTAIPAPL